MEVVLTSFEYQCWPVYVHCSCTPHLPCQGTLAGSGRGCFSSWKRSLHLMAPSLRTQPRYAAVHYQVDATCLEGLTCMQRPHACARCELVVTCWKVKKYMSRCKACAQNPSTVLFPVNKQSMHKLVPDVICFVAETDMICWLMSVHWSLQWEIASSCCMLGGDSPVRHHPCPVLIARVCPSLLSHQHAAHDNSFLSKMTCLLHCQSSKLTLLLSYCRLVMQFQLDA